MVWQFLWYNQILRQRGVGLGVLAIEGGSPTLTKRPASHFVCSRFTLCALVYLHFVFLYTCILVYLYACLVLLETLLDLEHLMMLISYRF